MSENTNTAHNPPPRTRHGGRMSKFYITTAIDYVLYLFLLDMHISTLNEELT